MEEPQWAERMVGNVADCLEEVNFLAGRQGEEHDDKKVGDMTV